MKITSITVGRTQSKDFQSRSLSYTAEVSEDDDVEVVRKQLDNRILDVFTGRKDKAAKLREMADAVETGGLDMEEVKLVETEVIRPAEIRRVR